MPEAKKYQAAANGRLDVRRCLQQNESVKFCVSMLLTAAVLVVAPAAADDFQGSTHMLPFEEDTIAYARTSDNSRVAQLQRRIDTGRIKLKHEAAYGYLLSVLQELDVPRSSQMLVFSKTSFQRERISPHNPRAVYFNDEVYIGFVPGSPMLEISAVDPALGGVFYTLEQSPVEKPRFVRTDQCLECHASGKTLGVPGHLVRSFETDDSGVTDLKSGVSLVNHRTPFSERWGGWYVTGTHGDQTHRGNLIGSEAFDRQKTKPNYLGNLTNLAQLLDVSRLPAAYSDIVALLVLEHQTHMHNYLTRLNYAARITLLQYGHVRYLHSAIDGFLKYLLFTEEAELTAPVAGTSSFARDFTALGPRDSKGRSLRDFDLRTRLLKYPCSYLIYSDAFEKLPAQLKEVIYQRLFNILTGKEEDFDSLPGRQAILEILRETKPDLPSYWR
jgi:hypothetical protein